MFQNNKNDFPVKEFTHLITKAILSIENNADTFLSELSNKVKNKLVELQQKFPAVKIEEEKTKMKRLGLHEHNTYLYIRGHDLFHLCTTIGKQVVDSLQTVEKNRLNGDIAAIGKLYHNKRPFSKEILQNISYDYPEMHKIRQDMEAYKTFS